MQRNELVKAGCFRDQTHCKREPVHIVLRLKLINLKYWWKSDCNVYGQRETNLPIIYKSLEKLNCSKYIKKEGKLFTLA